jgi:hypothetical protein
MNASRKWVDPFDEMSDADFDARVGELFAARPSAVALSLRLAPELLVRVKRQAARAGVPYQTFMKGSSGPACPGWNAARLRPDSPRAGRSPTSRRREAPLSPPRKRRPNPQGSARRTESWLIVRVVLAGHSGEALHDPPGRDLLVSTRHSFKDLASAIDTAFARWDRGHLHEFSLSDGRRIGMADADEFGADGELDEAIETLATAGLKDGDTFEYVFDLGDSWEHDCTVLRTNVDLRTALGAVPRDIVPAFGWGAVPDQYGRIGPDRDESDE